MARSNKPQKRPKAHGSEQVDHKKQLPRLRRIEGQVRGLQNMIETERDCIDIAHQINAIIAALRRIQGDMLREHVIACAESAIATDMSAAEARRVASEIGSLITRLG